MIIEFRTRRDSLFPTNFNNTEEVTRSELIRKQKVEGVDLKHDKTKIIQFSFQDS